MPTKKFFETVARAINSQVRVAYAETAMQAVRMQTLRDVAEQLCTNFVRQNPRFDRDRFMSACGLNS